MSTKINRYEIWNGKKMLGHHKTKMALWGAKYLVFPYESWDKKTNTNTIKSVNIPISYRKIFDDGVDITYRIILDVKGISAKEIKMLCNV